MFVYHCNFYLNMVIAMWVTKPFGFVVLIVSLDTVNQIELCQCLLALQKQVLLLIIINNKDNDITILFCNNIHQNFGSCFNFYSFDLVFIKRYCYFHKY